MLDALLKQNRKMERKLIKLKKDFINVFRVLLNEVKKGFINVLRVLLNKNGKINLYKCVQSVVK